MTRISPVIAGVAVFCERVESGRGSVDVRRERRKAVGQGVRMVVDRERTGNAGESHMSLAFDRVDTACSTRRW